MEEDHPATDPKGAKRRRPHPLAAAGVGFAHLPPRSTPPAAAAASGTASPTPSSSSSAVVATAQHQQQQHQHHQQQQLQQQGYLRTLPSRVQRADMLESEETNVIKSWDLLTLSPQYYDDLRLRVGAPLPGGTTATHAALIDEGSLADTELEVFPLEPRSARAALAKAKERRSLKARLSKQGPTEDAIAAVQELKEAARDVSKWAMLRAEVILGLDCIVLIRHKATGLFLSCVTSRPSSGEGQGATGLSAVDAPASGGSGSEARRLVFRRDGLSPASWFRLGPPPKGNSACHVLSASTRYIVSETMLAVSPVRLPGVFVSISGNRAQLGSASKAAVFKLVKHGSKKLPLLSGATVRLFHENLGNLTTEGNQAFFYSSAPSSELESLSDLWMIEKEDHCALPSDEEPTTTSTAAAAGTSSTSKSKSVGKQKDDGEPQRISLNDTFHVKHALSGQYLTLTRATRPNASSSSSSPSITTSSSSSTTTLPMGAELLQTSGVSASATSLESMPSFSSGSSRSLQVLLNQQRRAREEWEEAERERMQGSRQAAMPRKSSGFLSHQRDAAHRAREHAPEYHLALAPSRGEWTCFSFHHPFAHEDDRKKKKSKAGSSLHLVHAATGSCLYTSPATTKTGPLHAATKGVFRAILGGGGMEKAAAEKELFSVHPLPLSSPLPAAIAKAHALLQFFREAISSFKATGELPGSTIKAVSKALAELIRFCSSSADPYSAEAEPLLLPQGILIHPKAHPPIYPPLNPPPQG